MEEFIQEFKVESGAILETLQGLLLSYEESTSKAQIAEELFRGIHTLKGTSKMFGFDAVEEVTHQLEDILDECRGNDKALSPVLISLCMDVMDYCCLVLNSKGSKEIHATLLKAVAQYLVTEKSTPAEARLELYCILFKPAKDIFERGVNPLGIFSELQQFGEFIYFSQNEKVSLELQVANKKIDSEFELWLSTGKPHSDIADVFLFMKPEEFEILTIQEKTSAEQVVNQVAAKSKTTRKKDLKLKTEFIEKHFSQAVSSSPSSKMNSQEVIIQEKPQAVKEDTDDSVKLSYINVALPKLDQMMNLVSEFVTLSAEVKHYAGMLGHEALGNTAERLERFSTIFRDNAFSMRLVPIQILSVKLQRYVRELSLKMGKKVRFITEGMDTEIDKAIINQIEAPMMHIIRNAMDHGLEKPEERVAKGKPEDCILKISAFYSGTNAFIHIQDDGAGIDLEKVQQKAIASGLIARNDILSEQEIISLIFKPGFSTADQVSTVSGRGVGMDVVRKTINNLRGSIDVTTEKDLGTSFAIRLPLALSIMDVMIVRVGSLNYMFPHHEVEICTSEKFDHVIEKQGFNLRYRNELLPFLSLNSLFENEPVATLLDKSVLILNKNDQMLAVEVDEILGKEQVVIKPVDDALQMISYLSGTSILGNGDLAFLIDVVKLKELYARQE